MFLGFANFYHHFIRNYSKVADPLTSLTSTKITFKWTLEADSAFSKLKSLFTSAPILKHPDPSLQFLEVDASDTGVGAVLSQPDPSSQKQHPCAFFSRRLSLFRSGGTGLKAASKRSLYGQITKTLLTSALLTGSIPAKPAGRCSSAGSIIPCLIFPQAVMGNQIRSHVGLQRIKKLTVRIVSRIRVTDRIIFRISKKKKKTRQINISLVFLFINTFKLLN